MSNRKGFFRTAIERIMASRQREAERIVARYRKILEIDDNRR